jgi:hypothetical protein
MSVAFFCWKERDSSALFFLFFWGKKGAGTSILFYFSLSPVRTGREGKEEMPRGQAEHVEAAGSLKVGPGPLGWRSLTRLSTSAPLITSEVFLYTHNRPKVKNLRSDPTRVYNWRHNITRVCEHLRL